MFRRTAKISTACLALVGAVVLSSCGSSTAGNASSGAADSNNATNNATTVSLAISQTYYTLLPYWIAEGLGYIKQLQTSQNITIKATSFNTGAAAAQALSTGGLNAGLLQLSEIVVPVSKGQPITNVMAFWNGGVTSLLESTKDTASTVQALRKELGRPIRVGVSALGAGTDIIARAQLSGYGLSASDYQIVPLGNVQAYYPGLKDGRVDVVESSEPQSQELIDQNIGKVLVNGWDPATIKKLFGMWQAAGLQMNNTFLTQHPATAKAVVGVFAKALAWINSNINNPSAILAALPAVAKNGLTSADNEKVWDRIKGAVPRYGCPEVSAGPAVEQAAKEGGLLDKSAAAIDWSKHMSAAYLPDSANCS